MIENIYAFTKAGAQDVDDLIAGFTPHLFATGSSLEATTLARARTVTYSHLHGGHVAPSLDQIREIVTGAQQMAHTLVALERCYQGYSTFLDLMIGQDHRTALHFREFLRTFHLKQELEDEFGSELHTVLPLFQRQTELTMIRHFNDATLHGALAPLPRIMDLVDIIQFKKWTQLIPIPPRYLVSRGTNPRPALPPSPSLRPGSSPCCHRTGSPSCNHRPGPGPCRRSFCTSCTKRCPQHWPPGSFRPHHPVSQGLDASRHGLAPRRQRHRRAVYLLQPPGRMIPSVLDALLPTANSLPPKCLALTFS
jgi:hypothetical protein